MIYSLVDIKIDDNVKVLRHADRRPNRRAIRKNEINIKRQCYTQDWDFENNALLKQRFRTPLAFPFSPF